MDKSFLPCVIVLIILTLIGNIVHGLLLDLNQLTAAKKEAILELRELIKDEVTADYMKEDDFLAKWLTINDFNMDMTLSQIKKHLQWRQEEKIDTILHENEEWKEMNSMFPYTRHTIDKSGRPLLYFDLGKWDIYKFAMEKNSLDSLGRYFVKMLEESSDHVRQLQVKGDNVTQFSLIINLDGYSMEKHGCLMCLYFYRDIAQILAAHFPLSTERKVLVNAPPMFEIVYSFLTEQTQNLIKVFGRNRTALELFLLSYIELDQVPGDLLLDRQQFSHRLNVSTS